MKASFIKTTAGTRVYIQKSARVNGVPRSTNVKSLGLLDEIKQREGCEDPVAWAKALAARMTADEKADNATVSVELSPKKRVAMGEVPLRHGGDLFLLPIYNKLGLPGLCREVVKDSRVKYDVDEILRTLVFSRVLSPCSKIKTFEFARHMVYPPGFKESDMYRSLSLMASHINDIQAGMYKKSKEFMERKDRIIYFDCSNYYFEIEDNDKDVVNRETGEIEIGLRKYGKSKEHRPNPIVQMGLFMDGDGIPLAFNIFPGNESEQLWMQPLEEILDRKFGLTEFVASTDMGLASESNRRFNMAEGRDYICAQSIPSLRKEDQEMALDPKGWRIAFADKCKNVEAFPTDDPKHEIFNLTDLLKAEADNPGLLKNVTLYKEIIVEKTLKYPNPVWQEMERKEKGGEHKDANGKAIPKELSETRKERLIVTYSHDYALYLKHKRDERVKQARTIVKQKKTKDRPSQQSPRKYIKTEHVTKDGKKATGTNMTLDEDAIKEEAKFDGFYAYGTSLDDDATLILKARSFHHEIEHLFRTSKTFLDARPVYLSRADRIRSHFLICFIAMTILKILQKELNDTYDEYRAEPLTIDSLVYTLRDIHFMDQKRRGFSPAFERTPLTDRLQEHANIQVDTEIITLRNMRAAYHKR